MPSARTATTVAWLTSLAALLTMTLMVLVAGALTPGYSHLGQFISELGARGATLEWPFRAVAFAGTGAMLLVFCAAAWRALPRSRGTTLALLGVALYAAGYATAAVFPCDAGCRPAQPSVSQLIHNAVGGLGYLVAPVFLFTLARAARDWPAAGHLVMTGYVAAGLALVGLVTLSPASPMAGLSQRLIELAVLGWCALCGHWMKANAR